MLIGAINLILQINSITFPSKLLVSHFMLAITFKMSTENDSRVSIDFNTLPREFFFIVFRNIT